MKRHFMAVLIVVSVVPIAIYWWNFHNYGLSDDPADWGVFGDYIGGIYSVIFAILVVYLARNLRRRDEEKRIKQEAIRSIYLQINKIQQNQQPNQNKVTKLFRLIEECKLYIGDDLYERLKGLANCFGEGGRNRALEIEILDELKEEYEDR